MNTELVKGAIIVDNYKIQSFKRKLKSKGLKFKTRPFLEASQCTMFTVWIKSENVGLLKKWVEEANFDSKHSN